VTCGAAVVPSATGTSTGASRTALRWLERRKFGRMFA